MKSFAVQRKVNDELYRRGDDEPWDYELALETALRERDELLEKHPELCKLQDEIDMRLAEAESFEERMEILGSLIGEKLNHLYDECSELESLCSKIGVKAEFPITRFKRSCLSRNLKLIENKE